MVSVALLVSSPIILVCFSKAITDEDLNEKQEYLIISTACLDNDVQAMYDLVRQFMCETNWDNEKKLDSLVKNSASGVVNSIASSGSAFAELYASSKLTPAKVILAKF